MNELRASRIKIRKNSRLIAEPTGGCDEGLSPVFLYPGAGVLVGRSNDADWCMARFPVHVFIDGAN